MLVCKVAENAEKNTVQKESGEGEALPSVTTEDEVGGAMVGVIAEDGALEKGPALVGMATAVLEDVVTDTLDDQTLEGVAIDQRGKVDVEDLVADMEATPTKEGSKPEKGNCEQHGPEQMEGIQVSEFSLDVGS
jgi:hypothetical protein